MSLVLILYLIGILEGLRGLFIGLTIGSIFGGGIYNVIRYSVADMNHEKYTRLFWPFIVVFFVSVIGLAIIPSKDTAYAMLGAYGVEQIVANPKVQGLAASSIEAIEKALKDYAADVEVTKKDK